MAQFSVDSQNEPGSFKPGYGRAYLIALHEIDKYWKSDRFEQVSDEMRMQKMYCTLHFTIDQYRKPASKDVSELPNKKPFSKAISLKSDIAFMAMPY